MRPKRMWLQFSLRSLLVVMLVLPMVLGVYLRYRARSQRQWRLVNELKEAGGIVNVWPSDQGELAEKQGRLLEWQMWLGIDLPQELKSFYTYPLGGDDAVPLANLAEFPQLEMIRLNDKTTKDEDLAILAKLPRLRFLLVDSDRITDEGIASLKECTSLQEVALYGKRVSGRGVAIVASLPNLKGLHCDTKLATDGELDCLRDKPNLEDLSLRGHTVRDAGLEVICTCKNLKRLTITRGEFSGNAMRSLEQLKKLKQLNLVEALLPNESVTFPRESVASLAKLPQLESLYLSVELLPEDLVVLGSMTNLRDLTLHGTKLTGEGLKHLTQLKQLEQLKTDMTLLKDEDMAYFTEFPHLQNLDLHDSQVTDAGFLTLAKCQGLREISMYGTNVTSKGMAKFQAKRADVLVGWPVFGF